MTGNLEELFAGFQMLSARQSSEEFGDILLLPAAEKPACPQSLQNELASFSPVQG
jgi:hypothetical protein